MMLCKLFRPMQNNRVRFYYILVNKNLFNNYLVERIYGSIQNKRATGHKIVEFHTLNNALSFAHKIKLSKIKKGYLIEKYNF